ncbi:hypothetical protein [Actinomadura sp. KC216]|uniref:hypothetical protein n=1 Tax=Actinomadura sp. KC216 TaxID=2530370 RepID=UPI001405295C|nr:hypothetical protein [Actinomadura sp. KC216]
MQDYEDGTLVEISAPIGAPVVVHPIPEGGVWAQSFEHRGVCYVAIWYPDQHLGFN